MAECPLIPQLSRVLLESVKLGCSEEVLSIISMLSSDTIFFSSGEDREKTSAAKKTFQHRSGDHLTLLNVFNTFMAHRSDPKWCASNYIDSRSMKHVCDVRQQLVDFLQQIEIEKLLHVTEQLKRFFNPSWQDISFNRLSVWAMELSKPFQVNNTSIFILHQSFSGPDPIASFSMKLL